MARHIQAYLIVLAIYFIPQSISSPSGAMYFVSVVAWCWISGILYLAILKIRYAVILSIIEFIGSVCAIIAAIQFYALSSGVFYDNLEAIIDSIVIIELALITISLIGAAIGSWMGSRYNSGIRPFRTNGSLCNRPFGKNL